MDQQTIDIVTAAGFDVWMRNQTDTWMIFTDGKSLGYLETPRGLGYSISTVHVPNARTGTGFQIERHVGEINADMLRRAFILCPDWHRGDAQTVRKYRDIEDYRSVSEWNRAYKLVAKGVAA